MDDQDKNISTLDTEFDQLLADMKPHVMMLPHKSGTEQGLLRSI